MGRGREQGGGRRTVALAERALDPLLLHDRLLSWVTPCSKGPSIRCHTGPLALLQDSIGSQGAVEEAFAGLPTLMDALPDQARHLAGDGLSA